MGSKLIKLKIKHENNNYYNSVDNEKWIEKSNISVEMKSKQT